jgi:hypothetical protein
MAPPTSLYSIGMPRAIQLYKFRSRDLLSGKWICGRYLAELHEPRQRYSEWEIFGEPEIGTCSTIHGTDGRPGRRVASVNQQLIGDPATG